MEQELAASLKITAGFVMDVTFIFRIFVTLPRKNRNLSSTNNQRSNYFANADATAIRASWGTVQILKTDRQLPASATPSDLIPTSFIKIDYYHNEYIILQLLLLVVMIIE